MSRRVRSTGYIPTRPQSDVPAPELTSPPPSGLVSNLIRRAIPAGQTERQRDAYMTVAEEWREQGFTSSNMAARASLLRDQNWNTNWGLSRPAQEELSRAESRAMANGLEADWLRATSDVHSNACQQGVTGNYISTSTVASLEKAINTIAGVQSKPEQPKWNGNTLAAMDNDYLLNAAMYVQVEAEKYRRLEDLAFSRGLLLPKKIFSKKPVEEWVDIFLIELDKRAMKERGTT